MLAIPFSAAFLHTEQLAGATLGQRHLARHLGVLAQCRSATSEGQVVLLDFAGISFTTASYLKATALTIVRAAQLSAEEGGAAETSGPVPPLPIFPVLANLSDEVREEAREVLRSQGLVCLQALAWDDMDVCDARILGTLDRAIDETLRYLEHQQQATATSLFEIHGASTGGVTAFNNRLAELFRLRLARRVRQGRQWLYTPVAKEVRRG